MRARPLAAGVLALALTLALAAFAWRQLARQREPLALVAPPAHPALAPIADPGSLLAALERQADRLRARAEADPAGTLAFGQLKVRHADLWAAHLRLAALARRHSDPAALRDAVRDAFRFYRLAGESGRGDVFYTGYYLPELAAALAPDATFRFPLYRRPPDLQETDLGRFRKELAGTRIVYRVVEQQIEPYPDRRQIDQEFVLVGRGLELAYVADAIERFFLMIQGSGVLRLPDATTRHVNYDGQNGHAYFAIGRALADEGKIAREAMSMQAIRAYLNAHPEEQERVFALNPSYVFFKLSDDGPFGASGAVLTPGRSLALDAKLFPQGAIAYGEVPVLRFGAPTPGAWVPGTAPEVALEGRLLLVQDTGGAIRGPGRADLYCGHGPDAERQAGHLRHAGRLFLLLAADLDSPAPGEVKAPYPTK